MIGLSRSTTILSALTATALLLLVLSLVVLRREQKERVNLQRHTQGLVREAFENWHSLELQNLDHLREEAERLVARLEIGLRAVMLGNQYASEELHDLLAGADKLSSELQRRIGRLQSALRPLGRIDVDGLAFLPPEKRLDRQHEAKSPEFAFGALAEAGVFRLLLELRDVRHSRELLQTTVGDIRDALGRPAPGAK